ncbi:MAG: hypothetical protein ACUVRC_06735 [Desulfotomaculales bacterium]
MYRRFSLLASLVILVIVALAGCGGSKGADTSGSTPAPQEQAKPVEQGAPQPATAAALTAKEACTQLAASARQWADDARPYKLEGKADRDGAAITDGKCSTWRVWFSSPAKKEIWVYSFRDGQPYRYPEGSGGNLPYDVADWSNDWRIDSDKAAQIATEAGIKEVTLMHMYLQGASFVTTPREVPSSCKVWWDIYGRDQAGNGKRVYLDASTGTVLK